MTMRRVLIVFLVGVLGLMITPTAGARLSEKHICKVHRCTTVVASAKVRVWRATTEWPE